MGTWDASPFGNDDAGDFFFDVDENRRRIDALAISGEAAVGLAPLARRALDRVEADESELLELWDESGEAAEFRRSVESLRAVLAV